MNIVSLASYVPARLADNDYFSRITGKTPDWFIERTGIRERRRADDGENTNTLAVSAVRELESRRAASVAADFIFGCSYTPWDTVGTLAHAVQREFGLRGARAVYISSACSSVINAMELSLALIEAGRATNILVVAAEHNSLYARDDDPQAGHLWGDGAAAMLLSSERAGEYQVVDVATMGHGELGKGTGGVYLTPSAEGLVMPHGKDVFSHACREMVAGACQILDRNGLAPNDVRLLVPHQANMRIIEHVRRELGIASDRVASTVESLGNTGCASTLVTLDRCATSLVQGDLVLLSVFGGGYSSGAALLRRC